MTENLIQRIKTYFSPTTNSAETISFNFENNPKLNDLKDNKQYKKVLREQKEVLNSKKPDYTRLHIRFNPYDKI